MVELDEPALPLMPLEALPLVPEEPLAGGDPPAGRSAAPPDVPAALPEVGEPGVLAAVFIFTWPDASLQCVAAETLRLVVLWRAAPPHRSRPHRRRSRTTEGSLTSEHSWDCSP